MYLKCPKYHQLAQKKCFKITSHLIFLKYQPSSTGGTRSPPAKSKMDARGPQNGHRVWKGVYPYFSLNKFFDPSTMRKVDNGEK